MGRFDVYFDQRDLSLLADPEIAYVTDRFMGCTELGANIGWAAEDKVHIRLESPRTAEDDAKVAEVQLDDGGDLYFKIWNSSALRDYYPIEFEATAPFVTFDPSDKLAHAGIKSFCFHQLVDLSHELIDRSKRAR
ncbi:MAG: hypothetical protein V4611_00980 [Patescibacteria group bacterium]